MSSVAIGPGRRSPGKSGSRFFTRLGGVALCDAKVAFGATPAAREAAATATIGALKFEDSSRPITKAIRRG
jgi:hypothetical protein